MRRELLSRALSIAPEALRMFRSQPSYEHRNVTIFVLFSADAQCTAVFPRPLLYNRSIQGGGG